MPKVDMQKKKWHSTTLKRALIFVLIPLGVAAIVVNVLMFLVFK